MQGAKICNHCKKKKNLNNFCKNKRCIDGYNVICKECSKEYHRKWSSKNKEKLSNYMVKYRQEHKDEIQKWWEDYYKKNKNRIYAKKREWMISHPEEVKKYQKDYYNRHTERAKESSSKWIEKNKEKRAAHMEVLYALRRGIMSRQPCEVCGAEKAEAHHDDYSKPLEVRWLCHKCHIRSHHALSEVDNNININGGE